MEIRTVSEVLKEQYGEKIYRLALSSGCTCPNRDGKIMTGGCTFCSEGGSGDFAAKTAPVGCQIEEAKKRIRNKTDARHFIAYFQSFSNTYGDLNRLRELYLETIRREEIVILSVATRPDCLGDDVIGMLSELNRIKPVWVEIGLQTVHEKTAEAVHRGYTLDVFEDAYRRLKEAGLTVIVHVILSLPDETKTMMLETVRYLSGLRPVLDGIKIQMLHVLRGTQLAQQYEREPFHLLDMEEYTDLVTECLAILPRETVIHRMTGDGPRKLLLEPLWTLDKKRVLNTLNRKIREKRRESMEKETIYLAGGCFWGTQRFFDQFEGVLSTQVGYANGPTQDPTYEEVCNDSGHAETVRIEYDPGTISLEQLLDYYFMTVDPLSLNRQGHDAGIQYRTGIYYTTPEQGISAKKKLQELEEKIGKRPVIELGPIENFYPAESYHQKYLEKNPAGYCHIPFELLHLAKEKKQ